MRDLAARLVVAAGVIAARAALAGPERTPDQARADQLFAEGRALAKARRFAEACERFAASDALEHTFGTTVNLGDCAARDGQLARAWQLYSDAARLADSDGAPDRTRFARDRADALAPRLCTVIVTLAEPVPGTTVRIGDRDQPPAARIRALVDPGDIEVVVAAPGAPALRRTLHGAAGSVVALDVPAAASPALPIAPRAAPVPGFVLIERFDARSRAGIDLSYVRPPESLDLFGPDRPTVLRFEAHVRYVDPGGFGGYLRAPFTYQSDTDLFGDPVTVTDVGNIEIGGLLVRALSTHDVTFVVHAGATLPTGGTGTSEQSAGNLTSLVAMSEIYSAEPRGVTATSGISATLRRGKLYAHLDLGLDWNLYSQAAPAGAAPSHPLRDGQAIHYDAGAGIDLGGFAITLESGNAALPKDDLSLHAVALSARAELGAASLYAAIVDPLGDLSNAVELAVIAGAEFTFR